jgi:hypothetical protein
MNDIFSFVIGGISLLLIISIIFNFLLSVRIFRLYNKLSNVEGKVSLSEEELRSIKTRLEALKEIR